MSNEKLKVYRVQDEEGDFRIVEAASFGEAVRLWRETMIAQWKEDDCYVEDTDKDVEPEQVVIVSDEPVIRASS